MTKYIYILIAFFSIAIFSGCSSQRKTVSVTKSSLGYKAKKEFDQVFFAAEKQKVLNNNEKALELYLNALELDPTSDAAMYQLAKLHYAKNAYREALYFADKAVKTAPKYNHWYSGLLAQYLNKFGKYEESAEVFSTMIANEPSNRANYIEAANQFYNAKKFDESVRILKKMQNEFGIEEESSTRLDFVYSATGQMDKAVGEMKALVEAYPDNVSYKGYLSETLMKAKRSDEAINVLLDILKEDSTVGKAHFALFNIYGERDEKTPALKYLNEALKYDDLSLEQKMQAVGSLLDGVNRDKEIAASVATMVQTISSLYPEQLETYVLRTDYFDIKGEPEAARQSINRAIEINQSEFALWTRLIGLNNKLGKYDQQIKDVDRALDIFPNVPNLYVTKAFAQMEKLDYSAAMVTADEGLDIAATRQDKAQLLQIKAEAYKEQGNYTKSDKVYDDVLQLNPYDATTLNNYAYSLAERKVKLGRADTMINLALKLDPSNPYYLDTKAWVYYAMGEYEAALKILRKCIEIDPQSATYYEHAKACYLALKNENMANDMQQKIDELKK